MTSGQPLPIPNPEQLQPETLNKSTKRKIVLSIFALVVVLILANIIGGPPASQIQRPSGPLKQQQRTVRPELVESYRKTVAEQQTELFERTKASAATVAQLQKETQQATLDLQKAAALEESGLRPQLQQQQFGQQPPVREKPSPPDSLVRQISGRAEPVPAPWQRQATQAAPPAATIEATAASATPATKSNPAGDSESGQFHAIPIAEKERRPLDFEPSLKTYWLPEGTVMEAILTNRVTGEASGPVSLMITTNVYVPGRRLIVVPKGARVICESSKVSLLGQQRLGVACHRIIVPGVNGYSIPLDAKPGALAQAGEVGLGGKVNNHYAMIFGTSLAVAAIGGLAQIGNGQTGFGYDPSVQFRNGISQSMGQSSERILDRFLNRLPNVEIPEGTRARLFLTDDLKVPAYEKGGS